MERPWWFAHARCLETGIDRRAFTAARGGARQLAKTICSTCVVEEVCLWYAMSLEDPTYRHSTFGGTSPSERHELAQRHTITREKARKWYRQTEEDLIVYITQRT